MSGDCCYKYCVEYNFSEQICTLTVFTAYSVYVLVEIITI